jgi:hypothetical protein
VEPPVSERTPQSDLDSTIRRPNPASVRPLRAGTLDGMTVIQTLNEEYIQSILTGDVAIA